MGIIYKVNDLLYFDGECGEIIMGRKIDINNGNRFVFS